MGFRQESLTANSNDAAVLLFFAVKVIRDLIGV